MLRRKSKLDRIYSFICLNFNIVKLFLKVIEKNQRSQVLLDFKTLIQFAKYHQCCLFFVLISR